MRILKSWRIDGDLGSGGIAADAVDGELFGVGRRIVGAGDDDLVAGAPGRYRAIDVEGGGLTDVGHGDCVVETYPTGSRVGRRSIDGRPGGGDLANALLAAQVEDASIRNRKDLFAEECSGAVALVEDLILIEAIVADGSGGIDGRRFDAWTGGHGHCAHRDVVGDEGV